MGIERNITSTCANAVLNTVDFQAIDQRKPVYRVWQCQKSAVAKFALSLSLHFLNFITTFHDSNCAKEGVLIWDGDTTSKKFGPFCDMEHVTNFFHPTDQKLEMIVGSSETITVLYYLNQIYEDPFDNRLILNMTFHQDKTDCIVIWDWETSLIPARRDLQPLLNITSDVTVDPQENICFQLQHLPGENHIKTNITFEVVGGQILYQFTSQTRSKQQDCTYGISIEEGLTSVKLIERSDCSYSPWGYIIIILVPHCHPIIPTEYSFHFVKREQNFCGSIRSAKSTIAGPRYNPRFHFKYNYIRVNVNYYFYRIKMWYNQEWKKSSRIGLQISQTYMKYFPSVITSGQLKYRGKKGIQLLLHMNLHGVKVSYQLIMKTLPDNVVTLAGMDDEESYSFTYDNMVYSVFRIRGTWKDAQELCTTQRASLISFASFEELQRIKIMTTLSSNPLPVYFVALKVSTGTNIIYVTIIQPCIKNQAVACNMSPIIILFETRMLN